MRAMGFDVLGTEAQLKESLCMLALPAETAQAVWEAYGRRPAFFERAAKEAYAGELPDYPICKRSPLERLVIWCCRLTQLRTRLSRFPDEVLRDTWRDIALHAAIYQKITGRVGLSREDVIWFRHLEAGCIFRLGSLQFQVFHMVYLDEEGCGEAYMDFSAEQKRRLPPGSPVINVHVPAGADLSEDTVAASIRWAETFFRMYFPAHRAQAFLCYSWLLYSGLRELLPPQSRILQFARQFSVISQVADPDEAMERIFGKRRPKKADCPQETSLQRAALQNRGCLGYACGIRKIPKTTT